MAKRKGKPAQTGFWLKVDGEAVHVLGDPDMDVKTANAIVKVVRAAKAQVDPEGAGWHGWPGPYAKVVQWFEAKLNLVEVRYGTTNNKFTSR